MSHGLGVRAPRIDAQRFLAGPSAWAATPGLLATFDPGSFPERRRDRALRALMNAAPELAEAPLFRRRGDLLAAVLALGDGLLAALGDGAGASASAGPGARGTRLVVVACPREDLATTLVAWQNRILDALPEAPARRIDDALGDLFALWNATPEPSRLATAARSRRIPVRWLAAGKPSLALGEGRRRRIVHAGYLEGAPLTHLAGDKIAAARLLEAAGIPTTRPRVATTPEDAVSALEEVGPPLVVKPSASFAQVGVWLGLETAEAVRRAHARASEQAGPLAGPLLAERQHHGRYVRATLVAGRVAAVAMGSIPTVTGDGVRSAEALARRAFGLPAEGPLELRSRGLLEALLGAQGLTPASVPARGQRVHVGFPNQGRLTDVTSAVHPTLRDVLARVGLLFPLPVLGVDLLVRDPRGPFDPARDVVLEVNPNPAFTLHEAPARGARRELAGDIVDALFPGGRASARVPVIAAAAPLGAALEALASDLGRRGVRAAGYTRGRLWSGTPDATIGAGPGAAALLALDSTAEALLVEVDDALAEETGLPVDAADYAAATVGKRGPAARALARLRARLPLTAALDALAGPRSSAAPARRPRGGA